ncbi:MAG: putative toxin-antitoxin system toxin component, PIN family [Candidatus Omnitrophica bacterium]|nr:putative toxin-antitoxin system toxin component, PIN family [Candidatus Omnitrophota bacterium]
MKVVVDTNVLISAFLTRGTSKEVLDFVLSEKICFVSPYILDEFKRILFSRKFEFPASLIEKFVSHICKFSIISKEDPGLEVDSPDPNDRKILALCQTIKADIFVTGDAELIALKKIGSTHIVRPVDFWKITAHLRS